MHYSGCLQILRLNHDRSAIEHAGDGAVWARIAPEPLARIGRWSGLEAWIAEIAASGVSKVIFHPGAADEKDSGSVTDEFDPIRSAWQSWAPSGHLLMTESVRRLDDVCAGAGMQPILWPRVHSLVSDIPGLLGVTRRWERVGVLLDPVALFARSGAGPFADFAGRLQEVIGMPGMSALVVEDAKGESATLEEFTSLVRAANGRGLPIVLSHELADRELEKMRLRPTPDRT